MATSDLPAGGQDPVAGSSTLPPELIRPAQAHAEFGALTHIGKVRPNNEDHYLIARLCKSVEVLQSSLPDDDDPDLADLMAYLMVVADGVGGHAAGERASAMVVREARKYVLLAAKWFFTLDDRDEAVRQRLLGEGLKRLDRKIISQAQADAALAGMASTLTAALSIGAELFLVQVGDSRAYLFRGGHLTQLTRDHTLAQTMIDAGLLQPEAARTARVRHVLTSALGGSPGVEAQFQKLHLANGDRLLLCTDGLTELVGDEQIADLLSVNPCPKEACQALVNAALGLGGKDNITVVLTAYSIQQRT
jgi:protein phosphatase